jgi:hypothetical protein
MNARLTGVTLFGATALWLTAGSLHADEGKPYHAEAAPKIFTDWRTSSDGRISISLAVEKTTFGPKETVTLRCAIRNLSDQPLVTLRPLGDRYYAESQGLTILGPQGTVPFHGGGKEYALGMASFVELPAKMVVEDSLPIRREVFRTFGASGLYTVGYEFANQAFMYPKSPAPQNLWEGAVRTGTVSFQIKDAQAGDGRPNPPAKAQRAGELKPYREAEIPKTFVDWKPSQDGKVSICLALDRTTFGAKEPVTLRCAIRNLSDQPITILRPFGDRYYAQAKGLTLLGPEGAVLYQGDTQEYALGTGAFVELPPKMVVEETLTIPREVFPGFGAPGLYTVAYGFVSRLYPKEPPANYWQGAIKTAAVSLLIRDAAKANRPAEDE